MKFFDLFRKKANEEPVNAPEEDGGEELEIYSGMRVEVTTEEGRLIFVAKLLGLRGNQAELHQYSEAGIALPEEPIHDAKPETGEDLLFSIIPESSLYRFIYRLFYYTFQFFINRCLLIHILFTHLLPPIITLHSFLYISCIIL